MSLFSRHSSLTWNNLHKIHHVEFNILFRAENLTSANWLNHSLQFPSQTVYYLTVAKHSYLFTNYQIVGEDVPDKSCLCHKTHFFYGIGRPSSPQFGLLRITHSNLTSYGMRQLNVPSVKMKALSSVDFCRCKTCAKTSYASALLILPTKFWWANKLI